MIQFNKVDTHIRIRSRNVNHSKKKLRRRCQSDDFIFPLLLRLWTLLCFFTAAAGFSNRVFDVLFTNDVHRPETGRKLDETVIKELWKRELKNKNQQE